MRHKSLSILIVCLCLVSGACGKKPDAVFIVQVDPASFTVQVERINTTIASINEDGTPSLNIRMSGNVVVFRKDGKFQGFAGISGKAYRISEGCTLNLPKPCISYPSNSRLLECALNMSKGLSGDCKLIEIGTVDISKSDSDIAAKFGVYEKK